MSTSLSLHAQTVKELNTVTKDKIKLVFTTAYDFDDLVNLRRELEELDIKINYSFLSFYEDGFLKQISTKIEYPDGVRASFTSKTLNSKSSGPGFNWGFKKD